MSDIHAEGCPSDTFDPSVEWNGFATDTFNGLGNHTANPGTGAGVIIVQSGNSTDVDEQGAPNWRVTSRYLTVATAMVHSVAPLVETSSLAAMGTTPLAVAMATILSMAETATTFYWVRSATIASVVVMAMTC